MNSLIRAAKLDKSMHVLRRTRERTDVGGAPGSAVTGDLAVATLAHSAIPGTEPLRPAQPAAAGSAESASSEGHREDSAGVEAGHVCAPPQPAPTIEDLRTIFADELEALRKEATEQGYNDGLVSARAEMQQQYSDELGKLRRTEAQLADSLQQDITGLTEVGAEIVFEAVTKIIGRSYIDRSGIVDVVREVVRQAKDRSRLLIRVNPADYADLIAAREQFAENQNASLVDFAADDRIELGGCLLETPSGNLDGRLEVQLQQLRDTLMSARYRHTESVIEP